MPVLFQIIDKLADGLFVVLGVVLVDLFSCLVDLRDLHALQNRLHEYECQQVEGINRDRTVEGRPHSALEAQLRVRESQDAQNQ